MDSADIDIPAKKRREDYGNGNPPGSVADHMGVPLAAPRGQGGTMSGAHIPSSMSSSVRVSSNKSPPTHFGSGDSSRSVNSSSSFMASMFSSHGEEKSGAGNAGNSLSMLESFVFNKPTTGRFYHSIKDTIGTTPDQHNIVLFPEMNSPPPPTPPHAMGGMSVHGEFGESAMAEAPVSVKPKRGRQKKKNVAETVTTSESYNPGHTEMPGMYGQVPPGGPSENSPQPDRGPQPDRSQNSMYMQGMHMYGMPPDPRLAQQYQNMMQMMMAGGAYNMSYMQDSRAKSNFDESRNGRPDRSQQHMVQDLSQKGALDYSSSQANTTQTNSQEGIPSPAGSQTFPHGLHTQNMGQYSHQHSSEHVHSTSSSPQLSNISSPQDFSRRGLQELSNSRSMSVPKEISSGGMAFKFLDLERRMCAELKTLVFGDPVEYIYNPLEYAWEPHSDFVQKYCQGAKSILFLGMNPGPFGMVQTGVPFGEVSIVRDWLQVTGSVGKPSSEHPKRPVLGFQCTRNEVSGARFWGYVRNQCSVPGAFFKSCFVTNLCPLVFMNKSGKNLTPPDLNVAQRAPLNELCDRYLCEVVRLLGVRMIVGIGKYAQERAKEALESARISGVRVETILHPSPANPVANQGWEEVADKQLQELGVVKYWTEL